MKKHLVVWILALLVCFIVLWPVYWIVKSSFTHALFLYRSPVEYLPAHLTFDAYASLFRASNSTNAIQSMRDTLVITTLTLLLSVFLCALAGYGFSRTRTRGISLAFTFLLFSTMIPGTVTVLPLMIMWKTLQLSDTIPGLVILYFSIVIPFSTIMYTSFIMQVPNSIDEAATIDGASAFGAFFRVVFPLLKPVMATLCIINFISCINEFFTPLMFTSTRVKTLSTLMSSIPRSSAFSMPWDKISAVGCMMLLPTVLFILFFEKNIMEGLMMGSIKQ